MLKKRIICLTLLLAVTIAGCGGRSGGSTPPADGDLQGWVEVRRALPRRTQSAKVLPTPALEDERAVEGAEYIAAVLALYPGYGGGAWDTAELSDDYLRGIALYLAEGTAVGSPGAGGDIVLEVDRRLGHPRRFITAEQVQQVLYDYFDLNNEIEHRNFPPGEDEGEQYMYSEDYGIYLYPTTPPLPWLPVVTDCRELSGGGYEYLLVFLRQADSDGLSYSAPGGEVIPEWDVYGHISENPALYDWYLVTLEGTEAGGFLLSAVERL